MNVFADYLQKIEVIDHRNKIEDILNWVKVQYPNLNQEVKWNQPMFTDHGTYIIGFSISKNHISVAPENSCIIHFAEELDKVGYTYTSQLFRIKWDQPVDYDLLSEIIKFNILDKADLKTFWR